MSVELGGGVEYRARNFSAFADVRYGVLGHQSLVADFGADLIFQPAPDVTFRVGPRGLWGSQGYAGTYFGVTPAEAAKTNRLIDALYLSARENREVRVSEIG